MHVIYNIPTGNMKLHCFLLAYLILINVYRVFGMRQILYSFWMPLMRIPLQLKTLQNAWVILQYSPKNLKDSHYLPNPVFPKDEEIPRETGIVKIGPRDAGEGATHQYYKLYLSPFSDEQVEKYVRRRYPFWKYKKRRRIRELVRLIPNLIVRPMLLSYIDEIDKLLLAKVEEIHYSFELYEIMIEAWLKREEGVSKGIKREPLRKFSEQLAVDIYVNREHRHAECIPREDLVDLATKWSIPLMIGN